MIKLDTLFTGQKVWKKYSNGEIQGFIVSSNPYPSIQNHASAQDRIDHFLTSDEPFLEVYLDWDDDDYVQRVTNKDAGNYFYTKQEAIDAEV